MPSSGSKGNCWINDKASFEKATGKEGRWYDEVRGVTGGGKRQVMNECTLPAAVLAAPLATVYDTDFVQLMKISGRFEKHINHDSNISQYDKYSK